MADPDDDRGIKEAVTIPVMAKARIGHFVEAQVLEALGVDYIDESEVLTPGRRGAPHRQVGVHRAVRLRLHEPRRGAAPHRRGRGDDPHEGRGGHRQRRRGGAPHARRSSATIRELDAMRPDELYGRAKDLQAPRRARAHGWPRTGGCPSSPSPPAASPPRPTPRSDDAARRRRRVRRLGHLQVRRPARAREGDRRGDHALQRRRRSSPRSPAASARPMPGLEIATLAPEELLETRGW